MSEHVDDEISLLDLLLVIAENWILLIVVPLLIGAITFGALSVQPQTYRSEATVGLPPAVILEAVETGVSDGTIDPVLTRGEAGRPGLTVNEGADAQSSQLILIHRDRDAKIELDRLVADLVVAADNDPRLDPTEQLIAQITRLEDILALREEIIAQISAALNDLTDDMPFEAEAYAASVLALDQMLARRQAEEAELSELEAERDMAAMAEIVVSPPSGPQVEGRSPVLLATLAFLGSGFLLLVLVFIRAGLKGAGRDPETRLKLNRIKNAFLLKKTPS